MTVYLQSSNKKYLTDYQDIIDPILGFPEALSRFSHVGVGIHCDFEIGRAHHFDKVKKDKSTGKVYITRKSDVVSTPPGVTEIQDPDLELYDEDQ